MPTFKYFKGIEEAQASQKAGPKDALAPFDFNVLGVDTAFSRVRRWIFFAALRAALWFCREIYPIPKLWRLVVVTRDEDVRAVLNRPDAFEVPYGPEMLELAGGENFVLGLEGGAHDEQRQIIKSVIKKADAEMLIRRTRRLAEALIAGSRGRIDVMTDLITRVAAETCSSYFGLDLDDPDAFAEWSMAVSALLFADPFGKAATRQLALIGAAHMRRAIDQAIVKQQESPREDTIIGRLVLAQRAQPDSGLSNAKIRAILVGMATGFIPTTTLAAGNILTELLRRPAAMSRAIAEAKRNAQSKAPDKASLQRILFEAARLNPALFPGQWRYARVAAPIAAGTRRSRTVPEGSVLLVATASALRDRRVLRAPGRFLADRQPASFDLVFGEGGHSCLGTRLAMAQITEIFQILFSLNGLRQCQDKFGRMSNVGPFPRRLDMEFQPALSLAGQAMVTVCAPVRSGVDADLLKRQIDDLGNPAGGELKRALDAAECVHFASLSLIDIGDDGKPSPHLLLELNADGTPAIALKAVASAAGRWLGPIFSNTPLGGAALTDVLTRNVLDLQARPWGAIGLNFNGCAEFSVPDIARQEELAAFARAALDYFFRFHLGEGDRPIQALEFVWSLIYREKRPKLIAVARDRAIDPERRRRLRALLLRGRRFEDFLILPSRRQLQFAAWTDRTRTQAILSFVQSSSFAAIAACAGIVALALAAATFPEFHWRWTFETAARGWATVGRAFLALILGSVETAILAAALAGIFLWQLRRHEKADVPDDDDPDLKTIRVIAKVENAPGVVQNHFTSVSQLKAGWFRRLTLGLALWGINQLITHAYRPGFVVNMDTIHYARWFRPPGKQKLVFLSNYDGSWESYLEDFVMKAHQGQTAAWSNAVGFPETRFLVLGGAQDGDRFKRWVRWQQVPTQFWYGRFPELTTDQIRNNALIHFGLARALTDTDARSWLSCFGSIPRPDYAIETQEVQSLVFRGLRDLPYALLAVLRLPDSTKAKLEWLRALAPEPQANPARQAGAASAVCAVTFGDHSFSTNQQTKQTATFAAFSASGLAKLGLPGVDEGAGLATFPSVFNLGMANRGRVLGDLGGASPQNWRWTDAPVPHNAGDGAPSVEADAVLVIFAKDPAKRRILLDAHAALLGGAEAIVYSIETQPSQKGLDYENFGFRDGVSQPIIRGTRRAAKGAPARDIIEAGEFVLGYRNNQGYFPPTVSVSADDDLKDRLPTLPGDIPPRFPTFDSESSLVRDFGRNGAFMVVRQLVQDVDGFLAMTARKAAELKDYGHLSDVVGEEITPDWVAAKMMGRRRDGTSLMQPAKPPAEQGASAGPPRVDNDFTFALDDPQGLHCPFGAHIRRANPRDGLQLQDPMQQTIVDRHRLLRRGRSYSITAPESGNVEKGLLFIGLCADIERQFEFLQQSWMNSPAFDALTNEPDPIAATGDPGRTSVFTIPTSAGPVTLDDMRAFATVCAGGYFFLPSRSAIMYLADLNRRSQS